MTGAEGRPGDGFTLGVDLGTSHTVAMARWPDGRTRPLLFDGQPLLPSAVYLDTTGRLHVGRDALRLGQAEPGRFEPNPKRQIDHRTVLLGGAGNTQLWMRLRATSARVTAAATLAFSDSTSEAIGMLTRRSHVSPTRRDSPRPSEPTTTSSGPIAASS